MSSQPNGPELPYSWPIGIGRRLAPASAEHLQGVFDEVLPTGVHFEPYSQIAINYIGAATLGKVIQRQGTAIRPNQMVTLVDRVIAALQERGDLQPHVSDPLRLRIDTLQDQDRDTEGYRGMRLRLADRVEAKYKEGFLVTGERAKILDALALPPTPDFQQQAKHHRLISVSLGHLRGPGRHRATPSYFQEIRRELRGKLEFEAAGTIDLRAS